MLRITQPRPACRSSLADTRGRSGAFTDYSSPGRCRRGRRLPHVCYGLAKHSLKARNELGARPCAGRLAGRLRPPPERGSAQRSRASRQRRSAAKLSHHKGVTPGAAKTFDPSVAPGAKQGSHPERTAQGP